MTHNPGSRFFLAALCAVLIIVEAWNQREGEPRCRDLLAAGHRTSIDERKFAAHPGRVVVVRVVVSINGM